MSSASRPRKTAHISDSLHQQLNLYTLAASAAGVSVLALAGASEAKVVYTETQQVTHIGSPLYIDLNHDGIRDFLLRTTFYAGSSYSEVGLSVSGCHNINNAVAGKHLSRSGYFYSAASALRAGERIGPERQFPVRRPFLAMELFGKDVRSSQYSDVGPWAGKGKGKGKGVRNRYLGPKFVVHGKVHYGWARLSVTLGHQRQFDDVSGTLTGYAYETVPGKPIVAGKTKGPDVITVQPDVAPGSLGRLALGRK